MAGSRFQNDFRAFTEKAAVSAEEKIKAERRVERARKITGEHTTMPIEDRAMQKQWLQIAREHDKRRGGGVSWYLMLVLGFNTALRIGDLCKLRVKDVRGRGRVRILAEKTGKETDIPLREDARRVIDDCLRDMDGNDYVLCSRQRDRATGKRKPITRQRAFEIVKQIAEEAGFEEHTGCHTMRKTFAWNYYQTCRDLAEVQKVLNHSSQDATIRYLGLDRKKIEDTIFSMPSMV